MPNWRCNEGVVCKKALSAKWFLPRGSEPSQKCVTAVTEARQDLLISHDSRHGHFLASCLYRRVSKTVMQLGTLPPDRIQR